jgi:hypothetical protein
MTFQRQSLSEGEITRWGARWLMEAGVIDFLRFDRHGRAGITE